MGTFLGYYGDMTIPKEKQAEFSKRMRRILREGGMMGIDSVKLFGKEIYLLHTPETDDDGLMSFWYNYFENDRWESAGFDTKTMDFWTNKVGWLQFNLVCRAAYLLYEFYAESYGLYWEDGQILSSKGVIGWLNHLFDAQYANTRVYDPWLVYSLLHDEGKDDYDDGDIPPRWLDMDAVQLEGLVSYWIVRDTEGFLALCDREGPTTGESGEKRLTYPQLMLALQKHLRHIAEGAEDTEGALERLKTILKEPLTSHEEMHAAELTDYDRFSLYARLLPLPAAVKLLADQFGLDFWELYEEVRGNAPEYKPLAEQGEPPKPIPKISTEEFLGVSGDDRAYWWREGGDVAFSEEMRTWLSGMKMELDEIASEDSALDDGVKFLETLVGTLARLREISWSLMAFRDMFYEFISDWRDMRVQAAIALLQRLLDKLDKQEEKEEIKESVKWIQRYLAVLGNAALRQTWLNIGNPEARKPK